MNPPNPYRWMLKLGLLGALGLGLVAAGVYLSKSGFGSPFDQPETPSAPPSASTGVVCFGIVDLEAGVASLAPIQPGRIVEVLARENAPVAEGAVLLRLEDDAAKSRLIEAQAAQAGALTQLAKARKLPDQHRSRIAQQKEAIAAIGFKVSAARQMLDRQQQMLKSQLGSPQEAAAAQDQVKELEALERVEKRRLLDLEKEDPSQDVLRAEQEAAVWQARVEQARQGLADCLLKAPKAGTVLRLLAGPGDVVGGPRMQPAVLFAVDGPLIVRAEVEQEFAERVSVDQAVVVQNQSGTEAVWRGKVRRIANWYSQRRTVLNTPTQFNDVRTVECLIALDPGQPPLRIGQRVRVTIGSLQP